MKIQALLRQALRESFVGIDEDDLKMSEVETNNPNFAIIQIIVQGVQGKRFMSWAFGGPEGWVLSESQAVTLTNSHGKPRTVSASIRGGERVMAQIHQEGATAPITINLNRPRSFLPQVRVFQKEVISEV